MCVFMCVSMYVYELKEKSEIKMITRAVIRQRTTSVLQILASSLSVLPECIVN